MKWFIEDPGSSQKADLKMKWFETNIFPIGGVSKHTDFILSKIEPFVKEMLNNKFVTTFHCLPENNELRFRLYGSGKQIKPRLEKWLEEAKKENLIEKRSGLNPKYEGEENAAGNLGQQAYYVYMKAGCEIAFIMRGKSFEKPANFYHYRGFHFILDSCGFNINNEINFYIKGALQERIQTYRKFYPKEFERIKPILLGMITELQKWVSNL